MEIEPGEFDILLDSEQEVINEGNFEPLIQMEEEVVTETLESTEENSENVSKYDSSPSVTPKVEPNSENSKHRKPGRPLDKSCTKKEESTRYRPLHLPLARVKQIIKMDPDVHLAGSDAVFLIAKAAELFIELLSKDAYAFTTSSKKKTIQKKDVDSAIANTDTLIFLDGALDF